MYQYLKDIPEPFLLNPWKHHLGYMRRQITLLRLADYRTVRQNLLDIGESVTDVYTGSLSIQAVCNDLKSRLQAKGVFDKQAYYQWLTGVSIYEVLPVSDQSRWLMRPGNDKRYIHIHPAKVSKHVCRLKSQQIKTAILYLIFRTSKAEISRLDLINQLREDYLELPPLISESESLLFIIGLLDDTDK
ncbi:MAG: hypothetical protein ACQES0_03435 [Bacteroidota bacterium]